MTIFDLDHSKKFWSIFSLCQFECKKSVNYINLFLWYSQFLSPETRLATPTFDLCPTKKFLINFFDQNFCEFVSTCKIWGYLIEMLWKNSLFKNPTIWFAEIILVYILKTRYFPNIGFEQEQQIFGSHEQNDYAHFWPSQTKTHWNNLAFLNLHWISRGHTGHTHVWPCSQLKH